MKILTKKFQTNRINVNIAELVYLSKKLIGTNEDFSSYYNLIKKLPEAVFHDLWSTPEAYLWSKVTWDLVHSDTKNSEFLKEYLKWNKKTIKQQITMQIEKLALFALSGYIISRKNIKFPKLISIPKQGSLPSLQISWSSDKVIKIAGFIDNKLIIKVDKKDLKLDIFDLKKDKQTNPFFLQPNVTDSLITIDIWSECAQLDFVGMEWIERINSNFKIKNFTDNLYESTKIIKRFNIEIYNEILLLIKKIVPLKVISSAVPSSSNSTMQGIIFCTYVKDPLLISEMLIHECSHNKLFLLQEVDPVLDPKIHGDGWTIEKYYSPWRSDPRPLNGILHGLFVFSEVIKFWNYIIKLKNNKDYKHISYKRYYLLIEQAKIALDVLNKHATFTSVGKKLIVGIEKNIIELRSKITPDDLNKTEAHFAELNYDPDLKGNSVANVIKEHKRKWMNYNYV